MIWLIAIRKVNLHIHHIFIQTWKIIVIIACSVWIIGSKHNLFLINPRGFLICTQIQDNSVKLVRWPVDGSRFPVCLDWQEECGRNKGQTTQRCWPGEGQHINISGDFLKYPVQLLSVRLARGKGRSPISTLAKWNQKPLGFDSDLPGFHCCWVITEILEAGRCTAVLTPGRFTAQMWGDVYYWGLSSN